MSSYGTGLSKQYNGKQIVKDYEKGRNGWQPEHVKKIAKLAGLDTRNSLEILDQGTGTGLLAEAVVAHLKEQKGQNSHLTIMDPSESMLAAAESKPALQDESLVTILRGNLQNTNLPEKNVNLYLTSQTLHWGTRDEKDFEDTVAETLRVVAPEGAFFALYNAPVYTKEDSFTNELNNLLAEKTPDPYYQALTSGDWENFKGEGGKSNLGRFFNEVAQESGGKFVQTTMDNVKHHATVDTITSYVFSNAFVKNAVKNAEAQESVNAGESVFEKTLRNDISALYEKYDNGDGVTYGDTSLIMGVTGMNGPA